jgi:murein tripeptide amidase MpaA
MFITSEFDAGNIRCLDCSNTANVQLEIKTDNDSDFYQWFYFRASNVAGSNCVFNLLNAKGAAYPEGWINYQAVASYDRQFWFRVDTSYDDNTLSITHKPKFNTVYYAYFAPYSMERHADLIADALSSPRVSSEVLGQTLDGQDMDLLLIGEPHKNKKVSWVIARQHPGETMAHWWMEGFIDRLLDEDDPVVRAVLEKLVFYVVPNMNPDGSKRGHLRCNAAGENLNRKWNDTALDHSPEVALVKQKMQSTGVDLSLDVHGDEALPYNFIAGTHGIESWSEEREQLLEQFKQALMQANPDFQCTHGYKNNAAGTANLGMCSNYIAQTYGCLAMTLEMPFKDTLDSPNDLEGWSPERCRKLGFSAVDAIYSVIDKL